MPTSSNVFKERLTAAEPQRGLWCTLGSAFAIEVVAGAGFDWLLIDMEHSPNDLLSVLAQLQTLAAYPVAPVVRVPDNDPVLFKRLLDLGVQNFMVPDVQHAQEARQAAASLRYPPLGNRGVSALTRATRFGRIADYPRLSNSAMTLVVQIESPAGVENIDEIASVDGVDALFVGPGDLAARMGYIGEPMRHEVTTAVEQALRRIVAKGKIAGLLTGDADFAQRCEELGARLVAVGLDVGILARGADALARRPGGQAQQQKARGLINER